MSKFFDKRHCSKIPCILIFVANLWIIAKWKIGISRMKHIAAEWLSSFPLIKNLIDQYGIKMPIAYIFIYVHILLPMEGVRKSMDNYVIMWIDFQDTRYICNYIFYILLSQCYNWISIHICYTHVNLEWLVEWAQYQHWLNG